MLCKVCWILLKILKLIYASNTHSHGIITCSNTTDPDLGGGPQDLKHWNGSSGGRPPRSEKLLEEKGENAPKIKPQRIFLLKWRIIVRATLWWKKLSFYKMWLVTYSIFQLQYHGSIPWVDVTIPRVNSMGEWIPWVDVTTPWENTMGEWIPWVDVTYNTMGGCHLQYHG